ncbi:hypothetical protein NDU88_008146 [Pleurodeles waltl]|uniref:Uncharacterized protein n=1 Tax=Pleurodeles waltl TaxID=8319 RepID=A0AAV7NV38_PLEWA|nr:hypothetical protein NDU88_008146 [Pleurodeles waltl]
MACARSACLARSSPLRSGRLGRSGHGWIKSTQQSVCYHCCQFPATKAPKADGDLQKPRKSHEPLPASPLRSAGAPSSHLLSARRAL